VNIPRDTVERVLKEVGIVADSKEFVGVLVELLDVEPFTREKRCAQD